MCEPSKLSQEIAKIKKFAAYNGFPKWIVRKLIKRALQPTQRPEEEEDPDQEVIYLTFPYIGYQGESVVQKCTKRLSKLMKREKKVVFKVFLETTKLAFFTSNKDKTPFLSSSGVVYEYSCPGCAKSYVGKTNNTYILNSHSNKQKYNAVILHA